MTDIIERLKYFSGWSAREVPGVELSPVSTLCWDAIDEIERLRNPAQGAANPSREDIARCLVNNDPNYCCNHMPGDAPRKVLHQSGWVDQTRPLSEDAAERVRKRADAVLALPSTGLPAPAPHAEVGLSEQECHAIGHARYQVEHSTPDNPDCCFDYQLVETLLDVIDRFAAQPYRGGK